MWLAATSTGPRSGRCPRPVIRQSSPWRSVGTRTASTAALSGSMRRHYACSPNHECDGHDSSNVKRVRESSPFVPYRRNGRNGGNNGGGDMTQTLPDRLLDCHIRPITSHDAARLVDLHHRC